MLVDISPSTLGQVLGVTELPSPDLAVIQMPRLETEEPFDMHRSAVALYTIFLWFHPSTPKCHIEASLCP